MTDERRRRYEDWHVPESSSGRADNRPDQQQGQCDGGIVGGKDAPCSPLKESDNTVSQTIAVRDDGKREAESGNYNEDRYCEVAGHHRVTDEAEPAQRGVGEFGREDLSICVVDIDGQG